ncbi:Sugar kinase of the NBD/HSP70 family, may contain an N-terminal HTH domain [Jiangella alkaliphila]|uniref:Sugar kinase of the NBD/HSP70 family, may contain an N-terminal HTH domain n=2 Tax=Jiangella alkaliphila TaxID=419479 RepID=A0A1H2K8M9_9ACTN|nr:Sugar kinase of the NBD/HSP70 family, may contain an N-terminal HTH domain [Jiangella alkaliphila]
MVMPGTDRTGLAGPLRRALADAGWLPSSDAAPTPSGWSGADDGDGGAAPVVGVDLGGTKLHAVLYDPSRQRLLDRVERTDPRGGTAVTSQIARLVESLTAAAGLAGRPPRVAVGCPGAPDPVTGAVGHAPNIPGWDRMDVPADLEVRLGARPLVHNDANLAAWGEHAWLPGGGDLAFVAVGTGVGLGLVLGGRMYAGSRGLAGEVADLPFGSDPFDPANLVHGPLEQQVSGGGVERRYLELAGRRRPAPEVFAAAADGDRAAAQVLDELGRLLALAVRAVRAIVDPATFVLGGGIGSRPETLTATRRWLAVTEGESLQVRTSTFGNRAALAGALAAAAVA